LSGPPALRSTAARIAGRDIGSGGTVTPAGMRPNVSSPERSISSALPMAVPTAVQVLRLR
jgi:hypothetical protein